MVQRVPIGFRKNVIPPFYLATQYFLPSFHLVQTKFSGLQLSLFHILHSADDIVAAWPIIIDLPYHENKPLEVTNERKVKVLLEFF